QRTTTLPAGRWFGGARYEAARRCVDPAVGAADRVLAGGGPEGRCRGTAASPGSRGLCGGAHGSCGAGGAVGGGAGGGGGVAAQLLVGGVAARGAPQLVGDDSCDGDGAAAAACACAGPCAPGADHGG